jgi:hypothetical protein
VKNLITAERRDQIAEGTPPAAAEPPPAEGTPPA